MFIFLLLIICTAHCQEHTDRQVIKAYSDTTAKNGLLKNNSGYYLVKLYTGADSDFKKNYYSQVVRKFDKYWYVIQTNNFSGGALANHCQYALPANNNWKLSPHLITKKSALPLKRQYKYLIKVNNVPAFQSFLSRHTTEVTLVKLNDDAALFFIRAGMQFILDNILPREEVRGIDLREAEPKTEMVVVDYNSDVNNIPQLQSAYPAVRGDSLTVSIKENMFDTTDIDFAGRIKLTTLSSDSVSDTHATTMATLIGGAGNSFYRGKGMAPGALLSSSSFAVLMPDANAAYRQYNISVQNHSYGVNIEEYYGNDAAAYDTSMLVNPALLHIFSAGNQGSSAPADGQYAGITGFANITGSFKMSKNPITVGGVDTFYNAVSFSSAGPAYDGRLKPELVAYGNAGTSNAAAIVSGTALAVQDAYRQLHNNTLPANALVKAVLINSADDVGSKGVDFKCGYGNINAYRAVHDIQYCQFFNDSVKQGETKDFLLTIPANAKSLKLTLVWNDAPAQAYAPTALVNDLDIVLQNNLTGQTWLPWVLNSYPRADLLTQLPVRMRDSLNNTEQITLDNPEQGGYVIHVKGYDIVQGTQSFYIACRWDTANTFTFTTPASAGQVIAGDKNFLRWATNYTAAGRLEYSIDGGNSWQLINGNTDLAKGYCQWNAPDTFAQALVRMVINDSIFVSGTFSLCKQLYPKVGFNCTDTFQLYWKKALPLTHYRLYYLGDKYLQLAGDYADTFAILHKSTYPYTYYAVAPVFANEAEGINSYSFDYTAQGVGCYIENFLADLQGNGSSVMLTLTLGTLYQVNHVSFEKLSLSGWQVLHTPAATNIQSAYTDNALNKGANSYRAVITLNNGETITTNIITVYNFSTEQYVIMPNPVKAGQGLTVVSADPEDAVIVIYDAFGRKLLQQTLTDTPQTLSTERLARGVYFVVITSNGKKVFSKTVLVE